MRRDVGGREPNRTLCRYDCGACTKPLNAHARRGRPFDIPNESVYNAREERSG
jgi:hypothetical protein